MSLAKHGEQRGGDRYDRPSFAWIRADEWQRRQWDREERIFARRANQGEPQAPCVIGDGMGLHGVVSQVDGKPYDSKSDLRRHYKQAGVIEIGNDVPKTRFVHGTKAAPDPQRDKKQWDAIHKAANRLGISA